MINQITLFNIKGKFPLVYIHGLFQEFPIKKKTQTEIAEVIGVTFQQIQKYEKSVNKLNFYFFVELCDYFQVDTGLIISNCKQNLYLPEELINQGFITVSSQKVTEDNNSNISSEYLPNKREE